MAATLLEYLDRAAALDAEFIVHDDGFRGRSYRYSEIASMANALRHELRARNILKGDAIILWSESRPGWVAALWACLADGIILVPVDPQSSPALLYRIAEKAQPKLILVSGSPAGLSKSASVPVWNLDELRTARATTRQSRRVLDKLPGRNRPTSPKLSSLPAPLPNPRASSSRMEICWRIWSRSRARSRSIENTPDRFFRCAF